jgi:hypothetical protein
VREALWLRQLLKDLAMVVGERERVVTLIRLRSALTYSDTRTGLQLWLLTLPD